MVKGATCHHAGCNELPIGKDMISGKENQMETTKLEIVSDPHLDAEITETFIVLLF